MEVNASVVGVVKSLSGHVHSHAVEGEISSTQIFSQRRAPHHSVGTPSIPVEGLGSQRRGLVMASVALDGDGSEVRTGWDGSLVEQRQHPIGRAGRAKIDVG